MARSLEQWLDDYGATHQDPRNKKIHFVCVPAIAVVMVALFWLVDIPGTPVNLGHVLLVLAMLFYFSLSFKLSLGMLPIVALLVWGIQAYEASVALPLWIPSLIIFVIAWIFQFIGHGYEGKKPSFFEDIQFLLVGPLWILGFVYDKFGINYRQ